MISFSCLQICTLSILSSAAATSASLHLKHVESRVRAGGFSALSKCLDKFYCQAILVSA